MNNPPVGSSGAVWCGHLLLISKLVELWVSSCSRVI